MGIGGSIIDPAFIEEYLGMRVESVDEVEIIRRMTEGIYDKQNLEKALAWTKANCIEGFDKNPEECSEVQEKRRMRTGVRCEDDVHHQRSDERQQESSDRLRRREMVGHNAIAAGFRTASVDRLLSQL